MSDPVRAALEFAAAIDRSINISVRNLAPADDPAVSVEWTEDNLTHLAVHLRSGRVIRGVGEAKLEAIADAEAIIAADRMGRA